MGRQIGDANAPLIANAIKWKARNNRITNVKIQRVDLLYVIQMILNVCIAERLSV